MTPLIVAVALALIATVVFMAGWLLSRRKSPTLEGTATRQPEQARRDYRLSSEAYRAASEGDSPVGLGLEFGYLLLVAVVLVLVLWNLISA